MCVKNIYIQYIYTSTNNRCINKIDVQYTKILEIESSSQGSILRILMGTLTIIGRAELLCETKKTNETNK